MTDELLNDRPRSITSKWSDWLGLVRFSHTIFALPFAVLATTMAMVTPLPTGTDPLFRGRDMLGILLCMVFARSAAMAFNRLVDHQLDARNPRTATRHLPAGILGRHEVALFTAANAFGFIASTALFWPNWLPLALAVPVLLFLLGYSLAKRFTAAAHLWLGVALSLAPVCAWVAIRGPVVVSHPSDLLTPVVLAVAVACWVAGFDIIYACQDAEFDQAAGLHSVPAKFGIAGGLRIAAGLHGLMLLVLATLPWVARQSGLGWMFLIVVAIVSLLVIRQHRLVRPDDLQRVNQAFFETNAIISLVLMVGGITDCLF